MDITVAIPTIPPRSAQLTRAVQSVLVQTYPATAIAIAVDNDRQGAPATRNRALNSVTTEWVAFLDDDDEFMPQHLERLVHHAQETGADYVYSWFECVGGSDPLGYFGKVFDHDNPTDTTITVMVRTELAKQVGFYPLILEEGYPLCEDMWFTRGCVAAGAKISHCPEITWKWHHWGWGLPGIQGNTSGLPSRW